MISNSKSSTLSKIQVLITLLLVLSRATGETESCNSSPELCDLRYNQVSFAGSHNSGSGFDGSLRQCNGDTQADCIWRNHDMNITAQLDYGIRFLEIDLCILPDDCNSSVYDTTGGSSLFTCRYGIGSNRDNLRYAGPIHKLFQQVNEWMLENFNDVIGLYFPANSPVGGNVADIFSELQVMLESRWLCDDLETTSSVCMSTYYNTMGEWPTLGEAIGTKRRIFVFVDPLLTESANDVLWNHRSFHSTYIEPTGETNICESRLFSGADLCNTTADILIEVGVTAGICINNGQESCNKFLPNATYKCYELREDQTVNVVEVDYPAIEDSTVLAVINELNERNIERYGPGTTPPSSTIPMNNDSTTMYMGGNSSQVALGSLYAVVITTLLASAFCLDVAS